MSGTENVDVDGVVNFQFYYICCSPRENEEQNITCTDVIDLFSHQMLLNNTTLKDRYKLEVTIKAIDNINDILDTSFPFIGT